MQLAMTATPLVEVRVLVVDDNPSDLALLRRHVLAMSEGVVEVETATSAAEALIALAGSSGVDAILLDYHLGDQTGAEVYETIRAAGFEAPVILLTDRGSEVLAVECLHSGMSDYIPKNSANPNSLRRAISNAVEKSRLERQVAEKEAKIQATLASLRARNDEIQSFYHTLSHELKTPLTAAKEYVSIILDGLQGEIGAEQRESLERTFACCDQMTLLLNDILDTTRLETGKFSIEPRLTSLVSVADQAVAHCRPAAARRNVVLALDVERSVGQAHFDSDRILQVLTNLIHNAIKYSAENGVVTLRIAPRRTAPGEFRVEVVDQGIGIPLEVQARVFDRLYQVSESDTSTHGGLGIGLYICRELVRLHGQEIELTSTPGNGSTFAFTLASSPAITKRELETKGSSQ